MTKNREFNTKENYVDKNGMITNMLPESRKLAEALVDSFPAMADLQLGNNGPYGCIPNDSGDIKPVH